MHVYIKIITFLGLILLMSLTFYVVLETISNDDIKNKQLLADLPTELFIDGEGSYHVLPSFLLIGERKCGTTSLFQYIVSHPQVLPPVKKEPGFFTKHHKESYSSVSMKFVEYATIFPFQPNKNEKNRKVCMEQLELSPSGKVVEIDPFCKMIPDNSPIKRYVTGEATATYLSQANPSHVLQGLPGVKLLVCLRCPIKRAISHHAMHVRFQQHQQGGMRKSTHLLPLNEALIEDMKLAVAQSGSKGNYLGKGSSYIYPGMYYHQISRWLEVGWQSSAFYVVFQEEMDLASNNKDHLQQFLRPIWKHIQVDESIDLELTSTSTEANDGAVQRLNEAPKVLSTLNMAKNSSDTLRKEVEIELCSKVFFKANQELSLFLARPLPKNWKCLEK